MSKSITLIASVISLSFAGLASAQYYKSGVNYANPDSTTTAVHKSRGPCADPWVTIALINVYGTADPSKCNVKLYNNGQWNDFNQLVHAVAKQKNTGGTKVAFPQVDLTITRYKCATVNQCDLHSNDNQFIGTLKDGVYTPVVPQKMVAAGGGNLVGNDGASMVAAGGGNMVAAGGGNMVAAGGGNLTALAQAMQAKVEISRVGPASNYTALSGVFTFRDLKAKTRHK